MRSLLENQRELTGIDDFLNAFFTSDVNSTPMKSMRNHMIYYDEDNEEYVLMTETPGFKKEDINVSTDSQRIIVKGEMSDDERKKKLGEREIDFERRFHEPIDEKSIKAKMEDGILEVRFKFKGDKSLKKISIE